MSDNTPHTTSSASCSVSETTVVSPCRLPAEVPYPTAKVLLTFALLGGALGGVLLLLFIGLLLVVWWAFTFSGDFDVEAFVAIAVMILPIAIGYGAVLGVVPAVVMALILVRSRWQLSGWTDYWLLFALGYGVSVLYFAVLLVGLQKVADWGWLLPTVPVVGGLSTMLLGAMVLPKRPAQASLDGLTINARK